jgi:hypothetical protein
MFFSVALISLSQETMDTQKYDIPNKNKVHDWNRRKKKRMSGEKRKTWEVGVRKLTTIGESTSGKSSDRWA